jgi:hypothetical protein
MYKIRQARTIENYWRSRENKKVTEYCRYRKYLDKGACFEEKADTCYKDDIKNYAKK